MNRKQLRALLLFFFISQTAFSNAKPLPGYYINLKGDTIVCIVDFSDGNQNPKSVRIQSGGVISEFKPEEIRGFGVYDYGDYHSAPVMYHTDPASESDAPKEFSGETVTKACFLKILQTGPYILYSLILPDRPYFFISTPDSSLAELVYRIKLSADTLQRDQSYKKEMFKFFAYEGISSVYFNRINSAGYDAASLESLVKILNEAHTGIKAHKKSRSSFTLDLFAGVAHHTFPTNFVGDFSPINQFKPVNAFSGGINLMYSIPGNFRALKVGLSFSYSHYNAQSTVTGLRIDSAGPNSHSRTNYRETFTLSNTLINSNLYALYLVNPLAKLKFYVKAGLNYSFSLDNDLYVISKTIGSGYEVHNGLPPNDFLIDNSPGHPILALKKSFVSALGSVGFAFGRSKLEFDYWTPVELGVPLSILDLEKSFKYQVMGLYYYFALFPEQLAGHH